MANIRAWASGIQSGSSTTPSAASTGARSKASDDATGRNDGWRPSQAIVASSMDCGAWLRCGSSIMSAKPPWDSWTTAAPSAAKREAQVAADGMSSRSINNT